MRRELLLWTVAVGGVLLAFGVTVLALNLTVYSATGFVRTYMDALARGDAPAALELAGPVPADGASAALLDRGALAGLDDFTISQDRIGPAGEHYVTVDYRLDGVTGTTEFTVKRTGALFGLFNDWSFATPPFAVVELTVQHDDAFTVGGRSLLAVSGQDAVSPYLAFTPSILTLGHDSRWLTAEPVTVVADTPAGRVGATVDVEASAEFVAEVQRQVDEFLLACTRQAVLLPTGCPFGQSIDNRLVSDPVWTMPQLPRLSVEPSPTPKTWSVPVTSGIAHLDVDVQSLFDGTISTFDQDVGFVVSYDVTFLPDDLRITPTANG